jgi:tetratricopeptide (TPR) repeat protein
MIFIKQGKTAEAIPHFAETVRLLPNDAEARFNLGLALLDNHRPAEAAVQFSEELRLTPDATKAHYRLAQALQQQNKLAGAVRALPRSAAAHTGFSRSKKRARPNPFRQPKSESRTLICSTPPHVVWRRAPEACLGLDAQMDCKTFGKLLPL